MEISIFLMFSAGRNIYGVLVNECRIFTRRENVRKRRDNDTVRKSPEDVPTESLRAF